MNCMKCGRETTQEQVFCDACLADMDRYPVKPGTPIHIPAQPQPVVHKKSHRRMRVMEPEEQISRLKKSVKLLAVSLIVLLLAWGVTFGLLLHIWQQEEKIPIGQNYSIVSSDAPAAPK